MARIILLTGPTLSGKTSVATRFARRVNALLLPMDQLQMYRHLHKGVGLDIHALNGIRTIGHQIHDPWSSFGPTKYVPWLSRVLSQYEHEEFIIIEGGCTSYLKYLLAYPESNPVLASIAVVGLKSESESNDWPEQAGTIGTVSRVREIVTEVRRLRAMGYIKDDGIDLFSECERLFTHPGHDDPTLAWAIRISAAVYFPAYLVVIGRLSLAEARSRMIDNVTAIRQYQQDRIRSMLRPQSLFCVNDMALELERFTSNHESCLTKRCTRPGSLSGASDVVAFDKGLRRSSAYSVGPRGG